jgi:hypothetical protein
MRAESISARPRTSWRFRATEHVRSFPTFTQDLYCTAGVAEAVWNKDGSHGVNGRVLDTAVPEFQILEERGFEVYLVNARHVKNVPGRRTDVSDCQCYSFCIRWDYCAPRTGRSRKSVRYVLCFGIGKAWCRWRLST